jgi:hypothetical protein
MPEAITPNQPIGNVEFSQSNEPQKTELQQSKEAPERESAKNSTEDSVWISDHGREMAKTDTSRADLDRTSRVENGKTDNRATEEVIRTKDLMHANPDAAVLAQGNMNPSKVLELLS